MKTIESICSRKSIRNFNGKAVENEELNLILKAANAAPVGMGKYEDVHLTVIKNAALLEKIDKNCAEFMNKPGIHPLYGAPALILVSSKFTPHGENLAYSNAAIIVENMALEAVELGAGVCHIWGAVAALNANKELLKELNIPEGFTPCCAAAVGKTDEKYELRDIPDKRISSNVIE